MSPAPIGRGFKWIGLFFLALLSMAQTGYEPWLDAPERSIRIVQRRTMIRKGPSNRHSLRGIAVQGSRFAVLERSEGEGCGGHQWLRVHEDGWICGRDVVLTDEPPSGLLQPHHRPDELTPWPYAFVADNTIEYRWVRRDWLEEVREVFSGYGFAVEDRVTIDGIRYFRTPEARLIPVSGARISGRVSEFQGRELIRGNLSIGWVNSAKTWVYAAPSPREHHRVRQLSRYDAVDVLERFGSGRSQFFRIGDNEWISARDVRVATVTARPNDVTPDEKWIDVDVAQQIVTAYRGDVPVYATLTSTGRIGASATINGSFRIWVKVAAIAMDNTDEALTESEEDVTDPNEIPVERHLYSLHDVPWAQFFQGNYGLHGVYWHDRFGNRRSSGCVNLSPRDARWFWHFTEPALPPGWWSIYTTETEPGTLIRIR